MNHHYKDIIDKLGAPQWWDEHAVPRYCEFSPDAVADIYARECVLLHIECQSCRAAFKVAMSWDYMHSVCYPEQSLFKTINEQDIHYGDPPNYCCAAGATMNSIPVRVLEYWKREHLDWVRDPRYEIAIEPDWVNG